MHLKKKSWKKRGGGVIFTQNNLFALELLKSMDLNSTLLFINLRLYSFTLFFRFFTAWIWFSLESTLSLLFFNGMDYFPLIILLHFQNIWISVYILGNKVYQCRFDLLTDDVNELDCQIVLLELKYKRGTAIYEILNKIDIQPMFYDISNACHFAIFQDNWKNQSVLCFIYQTLSD